MKCKTCGGEAKEDANGPYCKGCGLFVAVCKCKKEEEE